MCGRTALVSTPEDLREAFGLLELPDVSPRYNVPPSEALAVVRAPGTLEALRWGLVPSWAEDRKIAHSLTLARGETVFTTRAFRVAVRKRRCLVAVSGFYEWRREGKTAPVPFFVRRADGKPFALAGIWERWASRDGEVIESVAIVTHAARPPFDAVHHRMPVVLEASAKDRWLAPDATTEDLTSLLEPRSAGAAFVFFPVSRYVNDPRHEGPECVVEAQPEQPSLF